MNARRDRGHFGGHPRPEFMIGLMILGIALAVAIPPLVRRQQEKKEVCLGLLESGAACPASGLPYATVKEKELELRRCPDPKKHLSWDPRLERSEGGAWRPAITAPAVPAELPGVKVERSAGRLWLEKRQGGAGRWIAGPLLLLLWAGVGGVTLYLLWPLAKEGAWLLVLFFGLVSAGCWVLAWGTLVERYGVERVEAGGGRLTVERTLFGNRLQRVELEGARVWPVRRLDGALLVALGPGTSKLELMKVPEAGAGLAGELNGGLGAPK